MPFAAPQLFSPASAGLAAGVDLIELQKILGHVSLLTTVKYTHLTLKTHTKSENHLQMLWFKNEYHPHNDTGNPRATTGSFHVIKGGLFVM